MEEPPLSPREPKSSAPQKILFLTNSELGEANVFLALFPALAKAYPHVQVHLASFASLRKHADEVSGQVREKLPRARPLIFHEIRGLAMADAFSDVGDFTSEILSTPLGFRTTIRCLDCMVSVFLPYDGPQLVEVISSIMDIIRDVEPDLVVVDSLMSAGLTVCYHLQLKFMCLSPNSINLFAKHNQPRLETMWKHPAPFSGYPYPVPYHLIPLNIYYILYCSYLWKTNTYRKNAATYLAARTGAILRTSLDLLNARPPDCKILVGSLPELDRPLVIPPFIYPCGPIVRHTRTVVEADPELGKWLAQGPTIYVNLGSLLWFDDYRTTEMAMALRIAMDKLEKGGKIGLQVLWKLKTGKESKNHLFELANDILDSRDRDGRIRIVDWIEAEPLSILKSGRVICSVNHGGASSFNEAVVAGIPQVTLPVWTDCHDNAHLVEALGIGRHGSKATKPRWTADELSTELLHVLEGEASEKIRLEAEKLADLCASRGDGADTAAKILMNELPSLER
ncbi:glycosyltransferase family 1 [Ophiocordyceps camponoti-floridani]|uniref:Glycosyltransferase family 1 n=1 Tax=Ophiocordyceps camponoti-floridani TaxID=2030778 RepID=A0A8H4Q8F5_9HYPO|nr:glycosyltransferase family 1 [Ophiocordyceps camponoti-floridani]